jgi:uncharacterized protein (TIGR00375 family)
LIGTGDFTHPEYFQDLCRKLIPDPSGFYRLRQGDAGVRFVPTSEVANIYTQAKRGRRIHTLLIARSLEEVRELNRALAARGNVAADGRPIFGFSARHLAKLVREIAPETLVIPAHIWTPWFSVLGERSGFDSLAECFEEELPFIPAIETGLSSDPEMNWRLSQLDGVSIISNSDAHSPAKLGRESNAFAAPLTWETMRAALCRREPGILRFTVEFFPEEGKYHWPGHRVCGVALSPEEYRRVLGRCPSCGKALTGGVASRVEALADRPPGFVPPGAVPNVHLVPLDELLGDVLGKGPATKSVTTLWDRLVEEAGNELAVLLFWPIAAIQDLAGERVAAAVENMRQGRIQATPGYDGVFGKIRLFPGAAISKPQPALPAQLSLLDRSGG